MKLLVVYRPDSEYSRSVESFVHDFQNRHGSIVRQVETLSSQSREGMAMMSLYDIMQQPALLALADDGSLVQHWVGSELPLMDEVAAYFIH